VTPVQGAQWQEPFDPLVLRTFNLELSAQDWDVVRKDLTNDIEKPAMFWADDEAPILVSVRRKSSIALPSESDPVKVGLKIDINEFVDGQQWHGLVKLSLESGVDSSVLHEGYLWNLHRLAEGAYTYEPGAASWANVRINGANIGVYANVEQRDRQMLRNRGLPNGSNISWIYEQSRGEVALEQGDPHSPGYTHLCYSPFRVGTRKTGVCATPKDPALQTDLDTWVNMPGMLTLGAVDAFADNGDSLFSHGHNVMFADFAVDPLTSAPIRTRMYFPWDLDSAFRSTTASIYQRGTGRKATQEPYQQVILGHPAYRAQYNAIMSGLIADGGAMDEASQHAFIEQLRTVLGPALAADPYPTVTNVNGTFDALKTWTSARIDNVLAQVAANGPPAPRSP
jgi:hypothetical protein